MFRSSQSYTNDQYTVAWICTLPTDFAAAKAMLDHGHGPPRKIAYKADRNSYYLGAVGIFRVVIMCLPVGETGSDYAGAATTRMLYSFPKVRFAISIGTGQAIPDFPHGKDIHLGDVVIGVTDSGSDGLVLYDFGKHLPHDTFITTMSPFRQHPRLGIAVSTFMAEHEAKPSKMPHYVKRVLESHPAMREYGRPSYPDRLFQRQSRHVSGTACNSCDITKSVCRSPRRDNDPKIHYGIIASGSEVVRDTNRRHEIGEKHDAICIEREAAGIVRCLPCLFIRGISDYADWHRNKHWQPYAAVTAAACAKEFLEKMQATEADV